MERFIEICKDVFLLKVPFGPVWTGVVLIKGQENILIDSSATAQDAEKYILPALEELGTPLAQIHWLVNTHCHGDHIGGHRYLRQMGSFRVAAFEKAAPKVENPVPYAIRIRTAFPENSPVPQSYLQGVPVDRVLSDTEILAGRLQVLHTPGHDDDCVCFLDLPTGTLITGDSLQANGTVCQGVGFYQSLADYRFTLDRLSKTPIRNILCGHDYDGIGYLIQGEEAVKAALDRCAQLVQEYGSFIESRKNEQPVEIAKALIDTLGCGTPEHLFMALYTVTQHLQEVKQ